MVLHHVPFRTSSVLLIPYLCYPENKKWWQEKSSNKNALWLSHLCCLLTGKEKIYYPEEPQATPWTGSTLQLTGHPDHRESYKQLHIRKCDAHPCPHMMHFHSPGWPELPLLQASVLSSWNPSQASHPDSSWWQGTEETSHTGNIKGSLLYPVLILSFLLSFFSTEVNMGQCKGSSSQSSLGLTVSGTKKKGW